MVAEVFLVIALAVLGTSIFHRFIAEQSTASWIAVRLAKWLGVLACTLLTGYYLRRPWSLLLPAGLFVAGLIVHTLWCYRNGIHPVSAEPRERFLRLLGRS